MAVVGALSILEIALTSIEVLFEYMLPVATIGAQLTEYTTASSAIIGDGLLSDVFGASGATSLIRGLQSVNQVGHTLLPTIKSASTVAHTARLGYTLFNGTGQQEEENGG